ncbi:hypothetical protein [Desulfovibrio litoralis]|uniref:Lipoprotein n=1 Tax=Desulfovibrio litoralis DSM 11393 TaxID=1121455 RepID=A0A1M7THC2_9BACT|nr:hypothetical protein [Desulfovibrio litoralis]SHN70110.1 hypothetical protein SAMN02745728_01999 [Desulfovibrio litoralis DSM 11393]
MSCKKNIVSFFLLLLMFVTGCTSNQTLKDSWKGTKGLYREYLNKSANIDLEDKTELDDVDATLALAAEKIDFELRELERWLENAPPEYDQAWARKLKTRFVWLSGLMWTDAEGNVLAKDAVGFLKEVDLSKFLEPDPKQSLGDLRAYLEPGPLGFEFYIVNPIYNGDQLLGLVVAFFDPRNLVGVSPEPDKLVMADDQHIFWPGVYKAESLPLNGEDWAKSFMRNASGTAKNSTGSFKWYSRFLANHKIAYAVRESGTFPEDPEQMAGVDRSLGSNYGVGDNPLPNLNNTLQGVTPADQYNDVGNVGAPNVSPDAPAPNTQNNKVKQEPIAE